VAAPNKCAFTAAIATTSCLSHGIICGGGGTPTLVDASSVSNGIERDEASSPASLKRLVTTFDSDRSSAGAMFDVKAKDSPVVIRGMDINTVKRASDDASRVEIWTRTGSYKGYESKREAWVLWMNATVVGSGLDSPTYISPEVFRPILISAAERRAFYVAFQDGPYLHYNTMNEDGGNGRQFYINHDLILYDHGAAKRKGFDGAAVYPRTFSGALHYETIKPEDVSRFGPRPTTRPTARPTESPTSAPTQIRELATTFEHSRSYAGNMFDILARDDVEISTIAFHTFVAGDVNIKVYTREGSYLGHDKDLKGWTLVADAVVKGHGLGHPTYIPREDFAPVLVRGKHRQAFYITSDGPLLRAADGTSQGTVYKYNSDVIIYEGVGKRYPIEDATIETRVWNGILEYRVIDIPTPSPTTAEPTSRPTQQPTTSIFRLRLYWQRGYYWQESYSEKWWCMECRNNCRLGDSVYVDWCDSSWRQRFISVGDTIRPASDTSLCFTVTGYSETEPIRVMKCEERWDQKFVGLKDGGRFELQPKVDSARCISQVRTSLT